MQSWLPLLVFDALQAVFNDALVDSGTGPIPQQPLTIQVTLWNKGRGSE